MMNIWRFWCQWFIRFSYMSEGEFNGISQHVPNTHRLNRKGTPALELSHRLNTKCIFHGVIVEASSFLRRIFLEPFVLLIET